MSRLEEQLTEQFYRWERRGRGWQVFDAPIYPEPPFLPFQGHYLPAEPILDDGRKPTLLSSLVQRISHTLFNEPPSAPVTPEIEDEPEPELFVRDSLVELQTSLPADLDIPREACDQLLSNLALCREPVAFEILGLPQRVTSQFAVCADDAPHVHRQLQAYFPEAVFHPRQSALQSAWESSEGCEAFVVEFGLAREFMLPLASGKLDPFIGIIGALAQLQPGDLGLFQVLFQPVSHPWPESILSSVTHSDGKPFFVNSPELAQAAENKIAKRLYAAVVRIATQGKTFDRAVDIARDLASALSVFAHPRGNELIPLTNDDYLFEDHVSDVLCRQTRRSGMLLNSDELIGFVHLPSSAVRSPALLRQVGKSKAAPAIARESQGTLLGNNIHLEQTIPVRLTTEQRIRHTHIIGVSGTGKSTLLFNLIRQDIESGQGVAVLDPHGDLIDRILGIIPMQRVGDVVLVDPSDEEYSIGFNILSAHSDLERNLLASDLVSVFQRLSSSWGDQMQSVLQNAILAFLESSRGGTLADLRRFLVEPAFRTEFLKTVSDPNVLYYWNKGFAHLTGNKSIGPVLTRLEMFLAQKPICHMVSQPENRLDFANITDSGKIFLAKLPEGLLGKENSYLLGALLISKFQQLAMARQAKQIAARRDFWIYIDEFYNFITPSMAEILSGARKYRIGLTLAHHELRQLQRDSAVASAVLSHPCTRICFRLGDEDARKLSEGFSFFGVRDLQNLGTGEAIARIERSDFDFNLTIPLPEEPDPAEAAQRRQAVITASRENYGTPRAQVEAMLRQTWETGQPILKSPTPVTTQVPASPPARASEPKPAGVSKETDSEKQRPVPPAEPKPVSEVQKPAPSREPAPPRDMGKGGAQHQAIQRRIKHAAEALGFRAVIEQPLPGGGESVDLWLERGNQKIACEISVTTTIDHEVGNITKCLKAGFTRVAIVCVEEERLRKIAAAVSGSLGSEVASCVTYYQPDQLIAALNAMQQPVPKAPVEMRRGYKVKRSLPQLTPEEQRQKEDAAIRTIAETMRRRQ